MTKKVLIISSSPRKGGNSDLLCDEFMRGAQDAGNKCEKIFLKEKNIAPCMACDACKKNGGKCVQKDDMAEMLQQMKEADVIVMASPVYFYSICSQLKMFIDRIYAQYTDITDKEMYFIVTAAAGKPALERTIECWRGLVDCLPGSQEKGVIYGNGLWNKGDAVGSEAMTSAYTMGKNV
jgi:multimeric flavodoxin WrbA